MNSFAKLISLLFDPVWVSAGLVVLAAGLRADLLWPIGICLVLIFLVRVWLVRKKRLDWDLTIRAKRVRPLLFLVLVVFVLNNYLGQSADARVIYLFTTFSFWIAGFWLVTLVYKISGHTSVIALAVGLILRWYGFTWWPIIFVIPTVGWARVYQKKHTKGEVLGGAAYTIFFIVFYEIGSFLFR